MFTGIITDIGTIRSAEQRGDLHCVIACSYDTDTIDLGASIACSGVCLTVVDRGKDWFAVDISAESLKRSAPGSWDVGRKLNLERALKIGDELGGHIVTGHVDGVGTVMGICPEGDSHRVGIQVDRTIAPYVAAKGSIAIDGVSLTVNEVDDQPDGTTHFAVNIIPHTWAVTAFGSLSQGQKVNL